MKKRLREVYPLFAIFQIYNYLIFHPLLAIITAVMSGVVLLFSFVLRGKLRTFLIHIIAKTWARLIAYVIPMFVKIQGFENITRNQSYVIIANHQSQTDILAMYGWLPIDFRWIMKIELKKVPMLGAACERLGHIFIDRSNSKAAVESIIAARDIINNGTCIFFFPEGTRSKTDDLLPFKTGAFKFAQGLKLPMLPISISGTRHICPEGGIKIFPGKVKITIHPPIKTDSISEEDIPKLIAKTREVIESGIEV